MRSDNPVLLLRSANISISYAVGKGIHGRFLDEEDNPPPENQPVRQQANQELANEKDFVEPKDQRSNQIEDEIDEREHAIPEEGRATEEGTASTNAEKIAQFSKDNAIDGIDQSEMVVIPKIDPTNAEDINTRPRRMRFKVVSSWFDSDIWYLLLCVHGVLIQKFEAIFSEKNSCAIIPIPDVTKNVPRAPKKTKRATPFDGAFFDVLTFDVLTFVLPR